MSSINRDDFLERCRAIVVSSILSPEQKSQQLALEAENALPYPQLPPQVTQSLQEGILCDMSEGHAPYKPRYILPDYDRYLAQGSRYLELEAAQDFDDALNMLTILYHHIPSVTGMPVFLGRLDQLLTPYVGILTEEQLYVRMKRFWRYLDRTLPDAFVHADIGPNDTTLTRVILRVDAELKQVVPNLTFLHHSRHTPPSLLTQVVENICESSKPHIANAAEYDKIFTPNNYGIASCYKALPLAGGGSTMCRLNLKQVALRSNSVGDFFTVQLPLYARQLISLLEARSDFLYQQSAFFEHSFLVQEGLIDPQRFVPIFGVFALAEAVDILQEYAGRTGHYGQNTQANELGYLISKQLAEFIAETPVKNAWRQRAVLHSQAGCSSDIGATPGARIPHGEEPDPVTHLIAVAPHHQYYNGGISDILTLDATVKHNPQALQQLCLGAFASGMREFTANVSGNDLVRVAGYMVRLSDLEKFRREGSRLNTTAPGVEATRNTKFMQRRPRVACNEQSKRAY